MVFDYPPWVKVTDDRRPRMTLLFLEHVNEITRGKMQTDVEDAKHFFREQGSYPDYQMEEPFTKIAYRSGFAL